MKFCFELNCQKRAGYNYSTENKIATPYLFTYNTYPNREIGTDKLLHSDIPL